MRGDHRKRLYWERKLAGLCVDCAAGLTDDDTGVRCVECRAAEVTRNKAYAAQPHVRVVIRAAERALRKTRVEGRLCVDCGDALHERVRYVTCDACRRHRRLTFARRRAKESAQDATHDRMPFLRAPRATPYQPVDEREQNHRVRVLRALWWCSHDGEWADSRAIFLAARVDDDGDSAERNAAQVALGRIVRRGLAERRGTPTEYHYRVTAAGRAEIAQYRRGELPWARRRRAA